jgi:hypothetical protein
MLSHNIGFLKKPTLERRFPVGRKNHRMLPTMNTSWVKPYGR